MNREIKNLFNQEQVLELNLHNCSHQLGLYLKKLKKIKAEQEIDEAQKKQLKHFNKVFKFYKKDLIPALDEILKMDAKHFKIISKNPDKGFSPMRMEFIHHEQLLKQFLDRFESIHKDFHALTVQIKMNQHR